jgi:CheY-like chemotaxis protein
MESPKILILEDEGPIRAVLVTKFTSSGFTVVEAGTGEQALDLAQKEKPDVIMTDVVMYPIDGEAFITKLRASGIWGSRVPCYVLSNQNDPELITKLKSLDIKRYFNKAETPLDKVAKTIKDDLAA